MSGTDAMRVLRSDPALADIYIVALTAHALDDERASAIDAGFDAAIARQCLPDEPKAIVDRTLQTRRSVAVVN